MMADDSIVKALESYIDRFRVEYERLNEEEKNYFRGYVNLCAPCQIDVFLLEEPIKFQLLLISHDTNSKDKEIIIEGPFKPQEFLEKVEDFINKDGKWARKLPKESPMKSLDGKEISYGNAIIGSLANYLGDIGNILFSEVKKDELYTIPVMFVDVSSECVFGDIRKLDYDRFLQQSITLSKQFAKVIVPNESTQIITPVLGSDTKGKGSAIVFSGSTMPTNGRGYGVMFYPPVWIGQRPKQTLAEMVMHRPLFRKKAFDIAFIGKRLIFTNDGFVGIEGDNKEEAMGIFNTFFGIAHFLGVSCYSVNEDDIAEITIDKTNFEVGGMFMQGHSERMKLMTIVRNPDIYRRYKIIKYETIKSIVDLTENAMKDKLMTSQLTFLLEGYTYLINSEYSQSFIMDWLIIEKFFANKWEELLSKRKISGERRRDFKDVDKWDAYHKLELLNFTGEIDDDTYLLLRDFNTKRNRLVHKGEQISQTDAEKLYKLAFYIVKKEIGLTA